MLNTRLALLYVVRCSSSTAAHPGTVTKPPYYRKPHQHHKPKHMLQEEFQNEGDASGSGVRLYDYYNTAELVNSLPTIQEKIDFVSPYERPWTRFEKTWRRDWHPALASPRKAWSVPQTPAYFDCLRFYQYITKTRLDESSLDKYYEDLVPPTDSFEAAVTESLYAIVGSNRFDSEEERTSTILAMLFEEAMICLAKNTPRLVECRIAHDVKNESFWVRSGFMFLYDEIELGTTEVTRNVRKLSKYTGDDRRKLGELAFVCRDKHAFQLRSSVPLSHIFSIDNEKSKIPVFDENVNLEDILFSPKVFNLWPDDQPLWQCPGYFVESGETHTYSHIIAKSLCSLNDRCRYWGHNEEDYSQFSKFKVWSECAKAQAVASLFTSLNAQAHTHGFTQYTDVTRPFTSQMVLSDGIDFVFAVGQLNTIAINIECDGFVNDRTNLCHVEEPMSLYDAATFLASEKFSHYTVDENGEQVLTGGLNPRVLTRIMQMLMKN